VVERTRPQNRHQRTDPVPTGQQPIVTRGALALCRMNIWG